jgi:hypothetical protein
LQQYPRNNGGVDKKSRKEPIQKALGCTDIVQDYLRDMYRLFFERNFTTLNLIAQQQII